MWPCCSWPGFASFLAQVPKAQAGSTLDMTWLGEWKSELASIGPKLSMSLLFALNARPAGEHASFKNGQLLAFHTPNGANYLPWETPYWVPLLQSCIITLTISYRLELLECTISFFFPIRQRGDTQLGPTLWLWIWLPSLHTDHTVGKRAKWENQLKHTPPTLHMEA